MRKGFTLVEIAIVLVIIGLLIGGILAAQSMIATARVQNAVKTLRQFDVGVANFRTKYDGLPGDSARFSPAGDGDARIEGSDQNFWGYTIWFNNETANFWPHMQQGGFLNSDAAYLATIATNFSVSSPSPNSPKVAWDRTGVIAYHNTGGGMNPHYWLLGDYTNVFTNASLGLTWPVSMASIPAQEALSLDAKIDDGTPGGSVWPQNAACTSGGSYNTGAGAKCNLAVPMYQTTGMTQQ